MDLTTSNRKNLEQLTNIKSLKNATVDYKKVIISAGVIRECAISNIFNSLQSNGIQCEKDYVYRYQENNIFKSDKLDIIGNDFLIKVVLQRYWEHGLEDLNRQNKLVSMRFKILFLYEHENFSYLVPIKDLADIKKVCKQHKVSVLTNDNHSIDLLCKKILQKIPYSTIA
jgi:hypothetical protein